MVTTALIPIVRAAGEGEKRWWFGGGLHTWKARASETGGRFLMFEDVMVRGKMTPEHSHPDADETIYVLEGEIVLDFGGSRKTLGAGGMAMVPRGTVHAFMVTSEVARLLAIVTPGTAEAFYFDGSEPAGEGHLTGEGPVDFARIMACATKTGATEIIGPPPFSRN